MRKLTLTLILTLTLTLTTVAPQELGIMRRIDEMEKLEELQGQREQLAVAMQELDPEGSSNPNLNPVPDSNPDPNPCRSSTRRRSG